MGTVLTVLLDGVMVAVIGVAGQVIMSRMARHDKKEDQAEADKVETAKQVASIRTAVMLLMLDKIKHLGLRFIADGSITYEDRSLLRRASDRDLLVLLCHILSRCSRGSKGVFINN